MQKKLTKQNTKAAVRSTSNTRSTQNTRTAPPSARHRADYYGDRFEQNQMLVRENAHKQAQAKKRTVTRSTPDYTAYTEQAQAKSTRAVGYAVNGVNVGGGGGSYRSNSRMGGGGGGATAAARASGNVKNPAKKNPYIKAAPKKPAKVRERMAKFDYPLFTLIIVLLVFGLIIMFSASFDFAQRNTGNVYYYAQRQLIFIGAGVVAMILISTIDYHIFQTKIVQQVAVVGSIGLMLVVQFMGTTLGGSERWIAIGDITIQPSEILKFVVIIIMAQVGEKRYDKRMSFKEGFLPMISFMVISCGLMMMQPHLSGTIIIGAVGIILLLVSEQRLRYIMLFCGAAVVAILLGILVLKAANITYFDARITSWLDPESDISDTTYQTYQSLITVGSGGLFGLGLGNSRQKYSYLTYSHNDFVFSIVVEELGFIGAMVVILLFVLLVFRGFYIAARARDKFGMLLVVGITAQIGIQALLNIGVATNAIPNTGISLPFFSYGGSALMMQLGEMGVILNVSRKAAIE